jgi:hypothetical protein
MTNVHYLRTQLRMAADCIGRGLDALAGESAGDDQAHVADAFEGAEDGRRIPQRCTRPPAGWTCSRPEGHDGPCAALPAAVPTARELLSSAAELPQQAPDPLARSMALAMAIQRIAEVATDLRKLQGRTQSVEQILLEINVDACMKHGLNPF